MHFDTSSDRRRRSFDLFILSAIGLIVLVIAGINFVNLSLGRSTVRLPEVGLRKVVGAGRRQLVQQFWGESLVLVRGRSSGGRRPGGAGPPRGQPAGRPSLHARGSRQARHPGGHGGPPPGRGRLRRSLSCDSHVGDPPGGGLQGPDAARRPPDGHQGPGRGPVRPVGVPHRLDAGPERPDPLPFGEKPRVFTAGPCPRYPPRDDCRGQPARRRPLPEPGPELGGGRRRQRGQHGPRTEHLLDPDPQRRKQDPRLSVPGRRPISDGHGAEARRRPGFRARGNGGGHRQPGALPDPGHRGPDRPDDRRVRGR